MSELFPHFINSLWPDHSVSKGFDNFNLESIFLITMMFHKTKLLFALWYTALAKSWFVYNYQYQVALTYMIASNNMGKHFFNLKRE